MFLKAIVQQDHPYEKSHVLKKTRKIYLKFVKIIAILVQKVLHLALRIRRGYGMSEYTAEQVANWFLVEQRARERRDDGIDPMTQMKLHKLLYYAQGVFLALFNSKLFSDDLLAWEHGPVVRAIYDKYKGQRSLDGDLTNDQIADYEKISDNEDADSVLEAVYKYYGDYSASQLRNMTHSERPWKETEHNDVISTDLIKNFFKENIVENNEK